MSKNRKSDFLREAFENDRIIKARKMVSSFTSHIQELLDENVKDLAEEIFGSKITGDPDSKTFLDRDEPSIRSQVILGDEYENQGLCIGIIWKPEKEESISNSYTYVKLKYKDGGVDNCDLDGPTYNAEDLIEQLTNENDIEALEDSFHNSGGLMASLLLEDGEDPVEKINQNFEDIGNFLAENKRMFKK